MKETLRSISEKVAPFVFGAFTLGSRLFLVAVAIPATTAVLILAAASGWSFTGAALSVSEFQAEAQQLGKATAPDHLLVKRCDGSRQITGSLPKPSDTICSSWVVEEVPMQDLARTAGRQLAFIYALLLVLSAGVVAIFWPQSKLRVRERAATCEA